MKKIVYLLLILLVVGCVKVDVYDTDHPAQGKLTLTTDWSARTNGVSIPPSYTAESAGQKATLTGTTAEYPHLLNPGDYTLHLYNMAEGITLSGTTATATTAPQLGFQFWGTVSQAIEPDKDYQATVVMNQLTKQLEFDLTVSEGDPAQITSITATLGGIAGAWNCTTNAPSGTAITIAPTFTRSGSQLKAMVRILGTTGTTQTLTLDMNLSEGRTQREVIDLSTQLATFNNNKTEIAKLTGSVKTPILVISGGSINDWTAGGGNNDSEAN